jgi:hypothetical protein
MSKFIDWTGWILQKNNEVQQESLNKSDFVQVESLNKTAKDNALHRLFRDLAPHVHSATLGNLSDDGEGLKFGSEPHSEGLVGFNIEHHPSKKDIVNKILEMHGHFRHPKSFGEDMGIDDDVHHQYGAIQLHPDRAKNLKSSSELSATVSPGKYGKDKVGSPAIGSANLFEASATGEGDAKPAKWQGSDPRHTDGDRKNNKHWMSNTTRAGNPVATSSEGQMPSQAATSGVSGRGYDRVESGNPIKKA